MGAWLESGEVVCFLQGMSGVGKMAVARYVHDHWPGPKVLVTATGTDLGVEDLLFEIAASFERQGDREMADASTFENGLRTLLQAGALVVISEFDSAFETENRLPHKSIIDFLSRTSKVTCPGRILLVSDQRVSEGPWSERMSFKHLGPPGEDEAVAYLDGLLVDRGLEQDVPAGRRSEVVRWLACNPRAMQTFAVCLQEESLDDLIDLEPEAWALRDEVVSPELLRRLEQAFITKTLDRLDANSNLFIEYLSIYRKPFQIDAMNRLRTLVSDVHGARNSLASRFLLTQPSAGWFAVHPVVRYLARLRLAGDRRRQKAAHSRAADHYGRHFRAQGGPSPLLSSVGGAFVEARFHLIKSDRESEFESIAANYRHELSVRYRNLTRMPTGSSEARTLLVVLLAALVHDDAGFDRLRVILAQLLLVRGNPGDRNVALRQVTIATRMTREARAWTIRLELTWELEGVRAARAVATQAVERVHSVHVWRIYRMHAAALHERGMAADALAFLNEGFERTGPEYSAVLYTAAAYILSSQGRVDEAVNLLLDAYGKLGRTGKNRSRLFEQSLFIAYGRQDVATILRIQRIIAADGPANSSTLCGALILACQREYAEAAALLDKVKPSPVIEAQTIFFHLCARDVGRAAAVSASASLVSNPASSWLRALVALCEDKPDVYLLEMRACLERELTEAELSDEHLWVRVWLDRPTVQKVFPAFYFPVLPHDLTSADTDLVYSQVRGDVPDEFWAQLSLPRGSHQVVPLNEMAETVGPTIKEFVVNKYEISAEQVGAVGDKAKVVDSTFVKTGDKGDSGEIGALFEELGVLRKAMKEAATDPEHDLAVAEVAKAELAAKEGDRATAIQSLKKAGKWAFAVASTVGASLVASVLKGELGL
ncbi:tetratricopeptide repeat protein [Amycolatopsis japonica]|uniref:tetratricopeptide repeat protein n=1 Tax=Amycolatopsis japonica TaxID=208439 RepID=UPI0038058929